MMEKSQVVNILQLVLLSLLLIAVCLQNQGGGVTDEKIKSASGGSLRQVITLTILSFYGHLSIGYFKNQNSKAVRVMLIPKRNSGRK